MINICVLMSTYNGEKYIKEQIDSILNQIGVNVKLIIRDDGSTDKTIEILKEYEKSKKLSWYLGENLKPALSFMNLLQNSQSCDYYAFADQDDFWYENKLITAINLLNNSSNNISNGKLYISSLNIADSNLKILSKTRFPNKITIKNEMIKNYATGCTMVFDRKLKDIICNINCKFIAMHDSYIHRVALLSNSYIYYDSNSYILYRQHDRNVLGMTNSFVKKWKQRYNHFIHSECLSSRTACELLKSNLKIKKSDKEFLKLLANYQNNFKFKFKLLFTHVFDFDEFINCILFKIKLIFNKV